MLIGGQQANGGEFNHSEVTRAGVSFMVFQSWCTLREVWKCNVWKCESSAPGGEWSTLAHCRAVGKGGSRVLAKWEKVGNAPVSQSSAGSETNQSRSENRASSAAVAASPSPARMTR